jgi:hypothetical protein
MGSKVNLSGLKPGNEVEVRLIQMILVSTAQPQQLEPARLPLDLSQTRPVILLGLIFPDG